MSDAKWGDRLSARATTVLLVGLLLFTVAERLLERVAGPTRPATDISVCAASVVATGLAISSSSPLAVAGGLVVVCQCAPLLVEDLEGMTCP